MTLAPPTIAVIGTINRDTVVRVDRSRSQGYGGILYNLRVLAELATDASILPLVKIGRDQQRPIMSALQKLPSLNLSAVRVVPGKNNHCLLTYHDAGSKSEILSGWVGAVDRSQLEKALAAEIILVNFISGGDITLRNLRWLRGHTKATIFMDFHSRTLGRHRDGSRYLRIPPHWRDYLSVADFVQMNEFEFKLLARTPCEADHCRKFAHRDLRRENAVLIVTRGPAGCLVISQDSTTVEFSTPKTPVPRQVVDTTGCGDIFSAAFISHWRRHKNPPAAAAFASGVATSRVAVEKLADIDWRRWRNRLTAGNRR